MIHIPFMVPLQFTGSPVGGCTLINAGYAIECVLDPNFSYTVTGGPFSYHYQLAQFNTHFGSNPNQGSEHQVNGHAYAAEVKFTIVSFIYNSTVYAKMTILQSLP